MVSILGVFYLLRALAPYAIIVALLGWLLLFWLPSRKPGNWASGSAKGLAYLVCAILFVAAFFWFEWRVDRALGFMVRPYGWGAKLASLVGPALGVAMAIGLFLLMFKNVSKEGGESFYTIILGTAGLILLLGSGALFLGFLVE